MKIVSAIPEITFDDVLLLPTRSDFPIEEDAEKVSLKTKITKKMELDIPLISSPMPGVTEAHMAVALAQSGGIGFIHPFQDFSTQLQQIHYVAKQNLKVVATVTDLGEKGLHHVGDLLKVGASLISLETSHAHNRQTIHFLKRLKKKYRGIQISVSLVVTSEATEDLIKAGADSIRVGIGGGSHCTTRLETGVGRPQLSAVFECAKITHRYGIPLISDTGIKYAGDVAKALAFGADVVMIGGLFSGTDECPGDIVVKNGKQYKYSWGMCTDTAIRHKKLEIKPFLRKIKRMMKPTSNNQEDKFFEEGVEGLIPYKGSVHDVLKRLINGTKRSFWYQGAKNIEDLQRKARVVLVSANTQQENLPRISTNI